MKTRLAALAEESEFPKVKVRLNRPKNTEIPSPLTGHGDLEKIGAWMAHVPIAVTDCMAQAETSNK